MAKKLVETAPQQNSIPSANTIPAKKRSWLLISLVAILFFITCAATSLAIYNYRQAQILNNLLKQHIEITGQVQQAIQQNQQQTQGLVEQLKSTRPLVQANQQAISALKQQKNERSHYWQLNEIKYLLQLTDYNLIYQHDLRNGLNLLKLADQKLAQLNEPRLQSIRQAIANAKITLEKNPSIDMVGLQAKLAALILSVSKTNTSLIKTDLKVEKAAAKTEANDSSAWKKAWQNTLASLKQLVIIRHVADDQSGDILYNLEARISAQRSLQHNLEQASWALLHQQESLYQKSLAAAAELVQNLYQDNPEQQQALTNNINELQKIKFDITLPNIPEIIHNLNKIMLGRTANK